MSMKIAGNDSRIHVPRLIYSLVIIATVLLLSQPCKSALYFSVPEIRGTITDSTTGAPIENAVLVVRWMKTVLGPVTEVMKKIYVASDKNGHFRIPPNSSIHIFSRFSCVMWVVRHPLYSTEELGIGREGLEILTHPRKEQGKRQADVHKYASLSESGEVIMNISLLSLKEKFKDPPSIKSNLLGELDSEFLFNGPKYFSIAKHLGLQMNVDSIFMEWDEVAGRFPNVEYIQHALKLGKERVAEQREQEGPPWD